MWPIHPLIQGKDLNYDHLFCEQVLYLLLFLYLSVQLKREDRESAKILWDTESTRALCQADEEQSLRGRWYEINSSQEEEKIKPRRKPMILVFKNKKYIPSGAILVITESSLSFGWYLPI